EQAPDATAIVVPVGGGGPIAGIAVAVKSARPDIRVIGVEAAASPSARVALDAGRVVHNETTRAFAHGIAGKRVGDLTFPLIERWVDDVVTVSEDEIAAAVHLLLERQKLVAEGAGAAPLAALIGGAVPVDENDTAVLVVSGGNIDITMVERIIARGLLQDGRLARLMVTVQDRPGQLARLTRCVADAGANVLEIAHRRAFADISVGDVGIVMHLETRGREHVLEIVRRL